MSEDSAFSFIRNRKLTTVVILIIVISVIFFKLVNEPYIFDSKFGMQSIYGFNVSDAAEPFTVYYIVKGTDFIAANGDFRILNQSLEIGDQNNTSIEWTFDVRQFLGMLKNYGGDIKDGTLYIYRANPYSLAENASVSIYLNDFLVADEHLTTMFQGAYTWNLTTQWDIPGSNFGYPYVFTVFPIPIASLAADVNDNQTARLRVMTSGGVDWIIEYAILRLYSDPYALKSPWWHQNLPLLFIIYFSALLSVSVAAFAMFWSKWRASNLPALNAVKGWLFRNRFIIFCIGLGLLLRLILAVEFPLGSGDQYTYRFISMATYYYGMDTRIFYSIYGTVWHGLLLFTYSISLFLRSFSSSISLEYIVLKLPIIASDVLIAFLLYRIGSKMASQKIGRMLLIFWIFNPFVIWISPIWGTHHIVSTMFSVLAVERIVSGHSKSSAIALSAAVFSGLNNILLLPVFAILIYKSLGRPKFFEFLSFFFLGSSIFALPWTFSTAIIFNTYGGSGRLGFATLSYSSFLVPVWLATVWSVTTLMLSFIILYVYLLKKNDLNISKISKYVLIVLLIFYLTNTLVFPTYALWSLPFLLFAYVSARKVPFSYVVAFMSFPMLWIMYWSPPMLPQFLSAPGTQIFRDTFGLDFSIVCLLLLVRMVSLGNNPQQNALRTNKTVPRLKSVLGLFVPSITLIFIVFAPWIKQPLWLAVWDNTLKPSLTVLSMGVILFNIIMNWRKSADERGRTNASKILKDRYFALAAIAVMLGYNILILVSSQILPLVFNIPPVFLTSTDDAYFSLILVLLLPSIAWSMLRNRRNLPFVTFITILQIDYIITRHYSTYLVTNLILLTYVITDVRTFIVDVFAVALLLTLLVATIFFRTRDHLHLRDEKKSVSTTPESQ